MRFGWTAWDFWHCGFGQTDSPVVGSFDGKMRETVLAALQLGAMFSNACARRKKINWI